MDRLSITMLNCGSRMPHIIDGEDEEVERAVEDGEQVILYTRRIHLTVLFV